MLLTGIGHFWVAEIPITRGNDGGLGIRLDVILIVIDRERCLVGYSKRKHSCLFDHSLRLLSLFT